MIWFFLSCMTGKIQKLEKDIERLQAQNIAFEQRIVELEKSQAEYAQFFELLQNMRTLFEKMDSPPKSDRQQRIDRINKRTAEIKKRRKAREGESKPSNRKKAPKNWPEQLVTFMKEASRIRIHISKEEWQNLEEELPHAGSNLRITKHKSVEGFVDGYRVTGVRRQSVWFKLGFRNGDVVMAYNGLPLTEIDKVRQIYLDNRHSSEGLILIKRRGAFTVLEISFEPESKE